MDPSKETQSSLGVGPTEGVGTFLLLVEGGLRALLIETAVQDCLSHFPGEVIYSSSGYTFLSFSRPSQAVQAAVRLVSKLKSRVLASVMTSEVGLTENSLDVIRDRLISAASKADSGQVLTNLAAHELARLSLDADYSFDELGSFQLGEDGANERLLLVQHPSLPQREVAVSPSRGLFRTSTFIGRDREVTALRRQLDLSRTITIVGPAGIGKTALIHRLITEVESDFADGTHYIDLGPIARESMLMPTINRLLGVVKLPGEENLDALIANFRDKRTLLVFDSCEHLVLPVKRVIDALLGECPNVAVIAGSQTTLKTKGEDRFPLGGLEVPSPIEDWRSIREYEAVALFIDRAQLANQAFRFDETNAVAVVNLCRRLDGIPLAIELAATKASVLNPKQIVDRLDDRFILLQDRQRDASDRHQTLRATIDWSYGLLEAHDKALLRRLAVFAGTFSLDQAERVCAFDDELTPPQVFTAFEKLVDSSFLTNSSVQSVDKRFYLSETMRVYATAKLKEVREEKELLRRHREWCAEFSARANEELLGPDQLAWIERMDASYEDVRMVIEAGFHKSGDPLLAVDTLISCQRFFILRNYLSEGLRLVEKAIDCKGCAESRQFPRVVNLGGVLANYLGDRKLARKYVLHGYSLSKLAGNLEVMAASLVNLAISVQDSGNLKKSCRYYVRAANAFRQLNSRHKLFATLVNVVGVEADLKLFAQAHSHLEEAVILQDEIPDVSTIAILHQNAAHLYLAEGDAHKAIVHTLESLPTFERLGNHTYVATGWRTAAHAAARLGKFESASIFLGAARKQGPTQEGTGRKYDHESLDDLGERLISKMGEQLFRSHALMGSLMSIGQLTQELERIRLA